MMPSADLDSYAKKMRQLVDQGMDLEVDARFIDMLAPRNSRILDIGCGIGSAVSALRRSGHQAYGIDPTRAVLDVAADIFDRGWYRRLPVEELSDERLCHEGLPDRYEVILMSGNVPAFLSNEALQEAFRSVCGFLVDGGLFVVGTTVEARGGPKTQDAAAGFAGLPLLNRFSDWHLGAFDKDSGWSVSVYAKPGALNTGTGPDGIFILKR
ncbi:class I SAM-dependent methyltransferase [Arthrobacter sp. zg-Y769]|uniref:class I SAM-dependent methyltransferase n=1 Tax=Arthrobacter sp. zg-Y769 TaxID=2894191 RepID=UPI001E5BA9DC|nr:methyltransferase domain-containing protein [Arthrobacter sp. zg-Y769]MCC9204995.1 class I SAM-dependent methyltransferase [Arthrobacter sp. zg-Y769]